MLPDSAYAGRCFAETLKQKREKTNQKIITFHSLTILLSKIGSNHAVGLRQSVSYQP